MNSFTKQFIGPWTWRVIIGALVIHILAFFFRETVVELPLLLLFGLATVIISYRSLPTGLLIAFTELFTGGHGHLLDSDIFGLSVSLRMIIFAAVMLIWFIKVMKKDISLSFIALRDAPWLLIFVAVVVGTLVGFLRNDFGLVFDDMNGYMTIAYLLPIISINWNQSDRRDLLQVLFGSAAWLTGFTLLLSYLFTHLDGKTLHVLYAFVRDSRLAEITIQVISGESSGYLNSAALQILGDGGYFYRIFMQSQFFVMIAFLVVATAMFFIWRNQRMPNLAWLSLGLFLSAIFLSMSRSFLLSLGVVCLAIFILAFFFGKRPLVNISKRSVNAVIIGGLSLLVSILTVVFPLPNNPDITDAAFYSTSEDNDRDLAISSRWSLLGPMMDMIYERPVLGSGFGTEVTYVTDDPRIRDLIPDGILTTYRFEWGYQDIWLKMGILGLAAFAFYVVSLFWGIRYTAKQHGHAWIVVGLGLGVMALYITHIFSPYLNHPIGLAYMLFIIPFIDWEGMIKPRKGFRELSGIQGIKDELNKQKMATQPVVTSDQS
ncbi:O-antigen ligase family protein [Patescibacteria group bacterium]|nr:O-antigen ligase family protein [Patescibacteria group bacterium]